jgi:radical SAM protein with 4Fe4S-binding SPASM domain
MTRAVIGGWQAGSRKQTQLVTACLHALITRSASPYFCGAGLNELTVFPNGDVFPCYMFPYDTFRMGNVLNGHIFDSDSFRAVQERFRANDMKQHSQCQQCWARSFCHVCLGASYAADQTIMNVPSSACALNQIIAKAVLLGLCHVSAEPDAWKRLCQNIATMADENVTKHLRYWI